jgi:hypothetical protein
MENTKEDCDAAACPACHPCSFRNTLAIEPIRSKLGTQNSLRIPFSHLANNGHIANLPHSTCQKSFTQQTEKRN